MSDSGDLRRRREALQGDLVALRDERERAFRANSDAIALQRAGVTRHDAGEMQELADDEVVGDSAMTDLRREIESIDNEIALGHGGGLTGKGRRIMGRLRR